MLATLISLVIIALAIIYWLDSARARELATAIVGELCTRRGYQFLDDTVALERVGIGLTGDGPRIKRLFRFDYSVEGMGRQQGHILMLGTQVNTMRLGKFDADAASTKGEGEGEDGTRPESPEHSGDNVVPFRRRH